MFGNMGNMAGMMKKVQKMQDEMKKVQEDLKKRTVEATAGGGAVKVVMNGSKVVESLVIDKAAVEEGDLEMLQDLIMAAVNDAIKKTEDMMTGEMGKFASSLGLPPGLI